MSKLTSYEEGVLRLLSHSIVSRLIYPVAAREDQEHRSGNCKKASACMHLYSRPPEAPDGMPLPLSILSSRSSGEASRAQGGSSAADARWTEENVERFARIQDVNTGRITLKVGPLKQVPWEDVEGAIRSFSGSLSAVKPPPPDLTRRFLGEGLSVRIEPSSGRPPAVVLVFLVPRLLENGVLRGALSSSDHAPRQGARKRGASELEGTPSGYVLNPTVGNTISRLVEPEDRARVLECARMLGSLQVDSHDIEVGISDDDRDTYALYFKGYKSLSRSDLEKASRSDSALSRVDVFRSEDPLSSELVLEVTLVRNSAVTRSALGSVRV